jgi:hypothetical protein
MLDFETPTACLMDVSFPRVGPRCLQPHVKKTPCESYMRGFCMDGPACKFGQYVAPQFATPLTLNHSNVAPTSATGPILVSNAFETILICSRESGSVY